VATLVSCEAIDDSLIDPQWLEAIADRMLRELELEAEELSVVLTNDEHIHELNREHREEDKPTDVLAFPMDFEDGAPPAGPDRLLGDVVISLETAQRQAEEGQRTLPEEVRFLLAHGLLHLIGYDHAEPEEKAEMDAMTERLVESAPL
jgi:probable rRNA maturation factor